VLQTRVARTGRGRPREGNFDEIIDDDVKIARMLELAPYGAEADVSGEGAVAFVDGLRGARFRSALRRRDSSFARATSRR